MFLLKYIYALFLCKCCCNSSSVVAWSGALHLPAVSAQVACSTIPVDAILPVTDFPLGLTCSFSSLSLYSPLSQNSPQFARERFERLVVVRRCKWRPSSAVMCCFLGHSHFSERGRRSATHPNARNIFCAGFATLSWYSVIPCTLYLPELLCSSILAGTTGVTTQTVVLSVPGTTCHTPQTCKKYAPVPYKLF